MTYASITVWQRQRKDFLKGPYDGNVIFRLLFAREVIVGSVACQAVIAEREKILKLQLMY